MNYLHSGIEPPTFSFLDWCSTNWANLPYSWLCPRSSKSSERAYWFHLVLRRRLLLFVVLYLFFFKSLPLLFQSVGGEVNNNSQWKFWNFLTIFKVFRPKNWKIVKIFKIELVPQFCLDPKDTWGLVRYRFWPKNVGIKILIFVPVFLKKNGLKIGIYRHFASLVEFLV